VKFKGGRYTKIVLRSKGWTSLGNKRTNQNAKTKLLCRQPKGNAYRGTYSVTSLRGVLAGSKPMAGDTQAWTSKLCTRNHNRLTFQTLRGKTGSKGWSVRSPDQNRQEGEGGSPGDRGNRVTGQQKNHKKKGGGGGGGPESGLHGYSQNPSMLKYLAIVRGKCGGKSARKTE